MQPFKHINAKTVNEAVSNCGDHSMVFAGGTDCLSVLKNRFMPTYPELLINIKTIPGMAEINEDASGLHIGAAITLADLIGSSLLGDTYGLLRETALTVASPQIREMGTLGGNLCQNVRCWYYRCSPQTGLHYPCKRKPGGKVCYALAGDNSEHAIFGSNNCIAVAPSDMAIALLVMDATLTIQGPGGERTVPIGEFYTQLGMNLKADEIVTKVNVPRPPKGSKQHWTKFRRRKSIDFAIVSVASSIVVENGKCTHARIALGGVSPMPHRADEAESEIMGKVLTEEVAEKAALESMKQAKPRPMTAYKVEIAKTLIKRAILS